MYDWEPTKTSLRAVLFVDPLECTPSFAKHYLQRLFYFIFIAVVVNLMPIAQSAKAFTESGKELEVEH